jgi:SAM-dependent methyltransferase
MGILNSIPKGVRTILDVGCGKGDVAKTLGERGYQVTAIAPIGNYTSYLKRFEAKGVSFEQVKFADFKPKFKFDLILMSESCGYFSAETAFRHSNRCLITNGHLLILNPFRKSNNEFSACTHVLADYLRIAEDHGYSMLNCTDITDEILPTLRLFTKLYKDHIEPGLAAAEYFFQKAPWKTRFLSNLLRYLFSKDIRVLERQRETYLQLLNADLFCKCALYLILLFRRNKTPNQRSG